MDRDGKDTVATAKMDRATLARLKRELVARGFTDDGAAPGRTVVLDETTLEQIGLGALLELMVARREQLLHTQTVVGSPVARRAYDDLALIIDAVKAVIG